MFQEAARSSSKSSSMKLKIIPKVKKEREKLHKQKSNSSLSGGTPPPGPLGGRGLMGAGIPRGRGLLFMLSSLPQEPGT